MFEYYDFGGNQVKRKEVPRYLGWSSNESIGTIKTKRAIRIYPIWMLQRLLDEAEDKGVHSALVDVWFSMSSNNCNNNASFVDSTIVSKEYLSNFISSIKMKLIHCKLHRRRGTRTKGDNLWFGDSYGWLPKWLNGVTRHNNEMHNESNQRREKETKPSSCSSKL